MLNEETKSSSAACAWMARTIRGSPWPAFTHHRPARVSRICRPSEREVVHALRAANSRGECLNARLGVKGIQNASSVWSLAGRSWRCRVLRLRHQRPSYRKLYFSRTRKQSASRRGRRPSLAACQRDRSAATCSAAAVRCSCGREHWAGPASFPPPVAWNACTCWLKQLTMEASRTSAALPRSSSSSRARRASVAGVPSVVGCSAARQDAYAATCAL